MICKLSRITIGADQHPRSIDDLKSSMLFFPVDRLGQVVDVEKAARLEAWAYQKDQSRHHGPDILRTGWSNAVTRKDGESDFGQLKYGVANLSLAQINDWGSHLVRFPLGDVIIDQGA